MGEVAALLTSVCWAFTAILFSRAGKAIGSVKLNRLRLLFAVLLLATTHLLIYGSPVPLAAGSERWLWLGLSGIVGLVIGDAFLLQAYVLVGARIGTLIMAVVPVISALLAWLFLDERLSATEIAGILVAVSGVGLVVLERGAPDQPRGERRQPLALREVERRLPPGFISGARAPAQAGKETPARRERARIPEQVDARQQVLAGENALGQPFFVTAPQQGEGLFPRERQRGDAPRPQRGRLPGRRLVGAVVQKRVRGQRNRRMRGPDRGQGEDERLGLQAGGFALP
jgi:uncharacterized membrane protein